MEQKTLGIDLGTNSLGLSLRNIDNGGDIIDQLVYYSSTVFKSGAKGELSYAAERTKYRSSRRLYQARRYRIWATLKLLIKYDCCPLKKEELERWSRYDKTKGLKREYPVDANLFEQWVRLDFDGDGIADYSSPYQLRAELMERQLDWDSQSDRYKFGRAMYHIAQRRGFKSNKNDTLKDAAEEEDFSNIDMNAVMEKSEEKKMKGIDDYMKKNNLLTVGCAFAKLEKEGIRVRNHPEYQAVQSQYIDEIKRICQYQKIDSTKPDLFRRLISKDKDVGTVFYRRGPRKQTGNIGKCILEPSKRRCPISHPDYEEFRALSFINNIKYRTSPDDDWKSLSIDERTQLFNSRFCLLRNSFKFVEIKKWIEDNVVNGTHLDYTTHTINYRDYTTVAGCPIIGRLKNILGNEWKSNTIETVRERVNAKTGEVHTINYGYEDLWHLCFSYDDSETMEEFAQKRMGLAGKQVKEMSQMWKNMRDGYTTLSIKAIRNILPFLREGLIYSDAVSLAKIPDIIGKELWNSKKEVILTAIYDLNNTTAHTRLVYNLANILISNYKSLSFDEQFAYKDTEYELSDIDHKDIIKCCKDVFGEGRWEKKSNTEQEALINEVSTLYQHFFATSKRDYYKLPKTSDTLKVFLSTIFPDIDSNEWNKLYQHSQTNPFPQGKPKLGTPNIGSIKNPVALRALYILRNTINTMLAKGIIDEDTRIVVETARDLNDSNWRLAIDRYQEERKKENTAIANRILEYCTDYTDSDIEKGRLLFEQGIIPQSNKEERNRAEPFALNLQKYKLWKDQDFRCIYTGKPISLSTLLNNQSRVVDIEHTIPRSISFDDSLSNKTLCYTYANQEKGNRLPSELPNYNDILIRIQPWIDRLDHIRSQIELWRGKARSAPTIERKNECLQQMHQWELDCDYWQAKVKTFTIQKEDLDIGFRNSQLIDTRIITKYAFHYLKSVFNRVDVEKGNVTSTFRKILGVQSVYEKKDRNKHSHHAIDATILTLIPPAARRDKMMELFYKIEESPYSEKDTLIKNLQKEIHNCHIGSVNGLIDSIEDNILVNHISKDQTLTPAKRKRRINGHIKEGQYQKGDCIRGNLHDMTFYGAILSPENETSIVVRKTLASGGILQLKEGDIPNIVDPKVRDTIEKHWKKEKQEGVSFQKAMEKKIYLLDKNGEPITSDRNGRPISHIRHVRCYTSIKNPIAIKKQTYESRKSHKQYYLAVNGENVYMAIYWDGVMGTKLDYEVRTLYEIAKTKGNIEINFLEDLFEKTKNSIPLFAIVRRWTRVIVFDKNEVDKDFEAIKIMTERFLDMNNEELRKRLYVVNNFENDGRITLIHNNEARPSDKLGKGKALIDVNNPNPKDRVSVKSRYMLIEGYHFSIDNMGVIHFNKIAP